MASVAIVKKSKALLVSMLLACAAEAARADWSGTFSYNPTGTSSYSFNAGTTLQTGVVRVRLILVNGSGAFVTEALSWKTVGSGQTGSYSGTAFNLSGGAFVWELDSGTTVTQVTGVTNNGVTVYPPPQRPTYGAGGDSCQVYTTRSGDLGALHVQSVTIQGVVGGPAGFAVDACGTVYYGRPPTAGVDFNNIDLSNSANPKVYCGVYVTHADGGVFKIFEGLVDFSGGPGSNSANTTTMPVTGPSITGPTQGIIGDGTNLFPEYGPGNPGDNNTPVQNPTNATTQPVQVTTQPAPNGSPTAPINVNVVNGGPGSGTVTLSGGTVTLSGQGTADHVGTLSLQDAGGSTYDTELASIQSKLAALNFDYSVLTPGGAQDMPVTVNLGTVLGQNMTFTFHTMPDTSTQMGQALDNVRIVARSVMACCVYFYFMWKILRRYEVLQ